MYIARSNLKHISPICQVAGDLIVIILIVASTGWHLDFVDLHMFHDISSPLHQGSRLMDTGDHTLNQFKLWNLPVGSCAVVDDGTFVVMEFLKWLGNVINGTCSECRSLRKVTEVKTYTDGDKEPLRDTTSYNADDVVLYIQCSDHGQWPALTWIYLHQTPGIPQGSGWWKSRSLALWHEHWDAPFDVMVSQVNQWKWCSGSMVIK